MSSPTPEQVTNKLFEIGAKELELLFQAVVQPLSTPALIVDDQGECREASAGAIKLLGVPREKIIGRKIGARRDECSFLQNLNLDPQNQCISGFLRLDSAAQEIHYSAKVNTLPARHLLALHDKASETALKPLDYAFYLLDTDGRINTWYQGAETIYGYTCIEVKSKTSAFFSEEPAGANTRDQLGRAISAGHASVEGWQIKKDGSRFWANSIILALKDEHGEAAGFAGLARDFSDKHERDEKLERTRSLRPIYPKSAIAGIVSGELDRISDANDAFLDLVGYSREDLGEEKLSWTSLAPVEHLALDELAFEEGMRFGACTPFEKELIRKDGTRVAVLIAIASLKLSPFRWIAFVQDLRERDRLENVEDEPASSPAKFEEMVGNSALIKRLMAQVEVVAPTSATVLILGETGTGKELVARAIHRMSPRRNLPFISLNCAAIPTGLLESELFGYERGAFTGALAQKIGRFEMANRGTLFLDEVGDIPLDLQPKLLRALQEKSFERLGGTRTIPIDVRLVAATNRNLTQMMGDKLFRSDLYYRLKVFPITAPPLRDRPDDIPPLVRHFTKKYSARMNRQIEKIPAETMRAMVNFRWPGNVRELENFIERAVILSRGVSLRAPLAEIREDLPSATGGATLEEVEREHIVRILRESGGVVTAAASRLGLQRTTLNAMMRKLGIFRKDF